MARHLPEETVKAIETAIHIAHARNKHPDIETIAAIFSTTYESVNQIRRRIIRIATTGIDERKKPGPRPLKNQNEADIAKTIRALLEEHPGCDQKHIAKHLEEKFGVRLGASTISRVLKRNGIPHKLTNKWTAKCKLVSTNPEGKIMPLANTGEGQREGEIGGLGEWLNVQVDTYRSPYAAAPGPARTPVESGMAEPGQVQSDMNSYG